MKNSLNLVLAVFAFIAIACSCPNLKDLDKQSSDDRPTSSNSSSTTSNTSTAPAKESSTTKNASGLTLENYNKIKNGMTYNEVKDIMGSGGQETMSSGSGKYEVKTYQWKGDNFQFLSIVFVGGKVTSKTQANLE